ncbi:prepilin peptidase [Salinispora arenicola]|uniref:prepilin peptidase n=1 Tax=Salinispora arenicola TaxID=168697 RepID=UPI00142F58A2|nr:A24 family peptidase [Salinispora arenicola]NIL41945.1 prepilin peptidase [Salinispora arenicola]
MDKRLLLWITPTRVGLTCRAPHGPAGRRRILGIGPRYAPAVLLPLVAAVVGAGWGMLVPGLVDRYAVHWPDGRPRPAWRTTCLDCTTARPPWWRASGRCPACRGPLTPGRAVTVPLAAATTAVTVAGVGSTWALPAFLLLAALAVPLALVDLRVLRLPDPLVGIAVGGGTALLAIAAVADQAAPALGRGLLAAALCGVGYLTLALLPRSQLGFGDVKLGAALGLYLGWLGWQTVVVGVLLAPLVNLPVVIGFLVAGHAGRRTPVPYGPAMLVAAIAATVL